VKVIRRRVVVWGRVQGVFFRDSCRQEATRHGVAGWVCNRPDGAVEAVFEGTPDAVDALCRWCATGPPHALVERIDVTDEPTRDDSGFRVVSHAPD
jgi:acylphosphatase